MTDQDHFEHLDTCLRRSEETNDIYGEWEHPDGAVYGFCSSDYCYGACELLGYCECRCHE